MLILIITITTLFFIRKYFPLYIKQINTTILALSIWLVLGLTLRYFFSDEPTKVYTDVEMAQNLIKEDPEFKKAKMKILDDGSVRITMRKRKCLKLKDGVLTSLK